METKMSWFNLIKRLFISKKERKEKKRRPVFGRFRFKFLPILEANSQSKAITLSDAEEEHSKHALTVALATVAAAEAAVAAAHAAAEVVRLTGNHRSHHQNERERRELAAIRIQTAFRGYLARKALRALKGVVKIQAMVRGRAVRRQAITTLKGLQSLVKIQSQIQAGRSRMLGDSFNGEEKKKLLGSSRMLEDSFNGEEKKQSLMKNRDLGDKDLRLKQNIQKCDETLPTKEEIKAIILSRKEALTKKENANKYSSSHQENRNLQRETELEPHKVDGRWSTWLEQWVDSQARKREKPEILNMVVWSNTVQRDEEREPQFNHREFKREEHLARPSSPISLPRRSFHQPKRRSVGENDFLSSSPVPSYMAATESTKARIRSSSGVNQRVGLLDSYSEQNSPSKNKLLFSSINSDGSKISKVDKPSGSQQKSPSMKSISDHIKSQQISKDHSFDSQCSLLNWDQCIAFR